MAFLLKRNPKTPVDLVRAVNELVIKSDFSESKKYHDDCARYLKQIKVILLGDEDSDPLPDQISQLAGECHNLDVLFHLIHNLRKLDFDCRKDVMILFLTLLRRTAPNNECPTAGYLLTKPDILVMLMKGPEYPDVALVCGHILRDCGKYGTITKFVLNHPLFWNYFKYIQLPIFEVATDAFATLHCFLTTHRKLAAEFLARNCLPFTASINALIKSDNYVTKRQSLKLLKDLVMQKANQTFLMSYFDDAASLKIIMLLLSDKSKNLQLEGFHIFKFFVAKPKKSQKILDILIKNKDNFLHFFDNFDVSANGPGVVEERDFIMHEIQKLPSIERI